MIKIPSHTHTHKDEKVGGALVGRRGGVSGWGGALVRRRDELSWWERTKRVRMRIIIIYCMDYEIFKRGKIHLIGKKTKRHFCSSWEKSHRNFKNNVSNR